jgi:hypothetical protein
MLACAVAMRGGLEEMAVAGAIEPMAKPSAWFSQRHGSEGAGLAVSGASAVTERRGGGLSRGRYGGQ